MEFLNSKPRSIYKDFYIWRYLDQNITSDSAIKLLGETKRVNRKLFLRFAKRIDDKSYKKIAKCYKMKPKEFVKSDADCIRIGFSVYDATKISKKELKTIDDKIKDRYKELDKALKVLMSDKPFKKLLQSDKKTFFSVFNHIGSKYRLKYFNKKIPKKILAKLVEDRKFNYSVKLIVTDTKLTNLQNSLLDTNSSTLNAQANFFLAMNALRHKHKKRALKYLSIAGKKFYYRFDKDKVLFWKYLITKDLDTLYKLTKSFDLNIYSIYALQKLNGVKPLDIISNIKCDPTVKAKSSINDPFVWLDILKKLNSKDSNLTKIADNFNSCQELPFKAFTLERLNYKKRNYFIVPYKKYLQHISMKKKALILSIARQESRFIPACISSSYALGMMQFMPFLASATAKNLKMKNFDLDDMFDPKTAYSFASKHLDYLDRKLHHPLLVAYAYNGGIGFTLRMLKSGLFKKGKYEPYLSMELVPYDESKRYGKKVVANYIVYNSIFGKNISIKALFRKLIEP